MSKIFKYDVVTLIELVENKPCLWDKSLDCFKDRIDKQKAWKEVYAFLEEEYQQKDKKEQLKIGEIITGKWQNIRDSFIKSLKKKSGQGTAKKYLYHDNLSFLLKVVQSDETHSSIDDPLHEQNSQLSETPDEGEAETEMEVQTQMSSSVATKDSCSTRKRTRLQEDIDMKILKALENRPDEDEAFFTSITPFVRKMSDNEKLEFRMNVLQIIKDMNIRKENSPCNSQSSGSSILLPLQNSPYEQP